MSKMRKLRHGDYIFCPKRRFHQPPSEKAIPLDYKNKPYIKHGVIATPYVPT
jgi:hypothetical protein